MSYKKNRGKLSNSFSIIIPAYKEEKTIENTLKGILTKFRENNFDFEIITVIDKAPNDKTLDIVSLLANNNKEIQIISREGKQGVANAIGDGIQKGSKSVTIIVMGDASEKPDDLINMALKMEDGYDMVFANRFLDNVNFKNYPKKKYVVNRLCNFAIKLLFGINSKDITNAVKAYKSQILKNMSIKSKGFEIFVELPIKAYVNGYKNFSEISSSHDAGEPETSNFRITKEGPRYIKIILSCFWGKK